MQTSPASHDASLTDAQSVVSNASAIDKVKPEAATGTVDRVPTELSTKLSASDPHNQNLRQVHGRGMNAHSDVYSLPVDQEEAQRLNLQHKSFYYLSDNSYYYGLSNIVNEVLAPSKEKQPTVLDLGCGSGAWTIQCATDFPQAEVLGIDLAPSFSGTPPSNCRFEVHDVNLGLERFFGETFDLIHVRLVDKGVKDYHSLVNQLSRCLRPGGLAIFIEYDGHCWSEDKCILVTPVSSQDSLPDSRDPEDSNRNKESIPTRSVDWALPNWLTTMRKCMRTTGGHINASMCLETWVKENPLYDRVTTKDMWFPIGAWKPTVHDERTTHPNFTICGEIGGKNMIAFIGGGRPLLLKHFDEQEVTVLQEKAIQEIKDANRPVYLRARLVAASRKVDT